MRHADCAVFAGIVTRGELNKMRKMIVLAFLGIGSIWLLFLTQQLMYINS